MRNQKFVIGIAGGLGPFAHIEMERYLLEAAIELLDIKHDQDFPEWILSSIPRTPDRTLAICDSGVDPTPLLVLSLRRLETHYDRQGKKIKGADFVIIPCNTSHKFLPEIRKQVSIPVLDMIQETSKNIAERHPGARVGILATTGTLKSGIYHEALAGNKLLPQSPLDLPDGEMIQRSLVMEQIYGPWVGKKHAGGGIKATGPKPDHIKKLNQAAALLNEYSDTDVFIAACTEISLALTGSELQGKPLVDPMAVIARESIVRAYDLHS